MISCETVCVGKTRARRVTGMYSSVGRRCRDSSLMNLCPVVRISLRKKVQKIFSILYLAVDTKMNRIMIYITDFFSNV